MVKKKLARQAVTSRTSRLETARGTNASMREKYFMGLPSLGLDIGISCDLLYSVLLLSVILGLYSLGLALSRPQVREPEVNRRARREVRSGFGRIVASGIKVPKISVNLV